LYMHGGGWVLGNLDTHDALCRQLAAESDCVVVAVDYGLSPESKFPEPLDDCFDVLNYVIEHCGALGIDTERLAVAGDSAGGNLAAALALKTSQQGGPKIEMQLLIYPVIEPNFESESYQLFADGFGLSRPVMQWFWQQYLADQNQLQDPLAVLTRAETLTGLPRAHVITAEYDVLRDEGELYAQLLTAAGVPTTVKRYDGMLHGFIHFGGVFDASQVALQEIGQVLRAQLAGGS